MIKTMKKLIAMSCGIGLAGAIAIPTTLMSSCSNKQAPIVVKFYYNFTLTSIYPTSYTIFENGIPTKKVSDLTINFKSDIIRQLKELETNGTHKFYFENTSLNELKIYTLDEFIIQFARQIAQTTN